MDPEEFRDFGKAAIDMIATYTEGLRDRDVLPSVEPGYLHKMVPTEMPKQGEDWRNILEDMERVILPGVSFFTLQCIGTISSAQDHTRTQTTVDNDKKYSCRSPTGSHQISTHTIRRVRHTRLLLGSFSVPDLGLLDSVG